MKTRSRTFSGSRSWPSRRRTSLKRSGNDGCGWTSVSPASKKIARTGTRACYRRAKEPPLVLLDVARVCPLARGALEVAPEAVDLGLQLLERSTVVEDHVGLGGAFVVGGLGRHPGSDIR